MLLHLIAFGIISTSGSVIEPGTGDVNAPAGHTASAKANTASSGTGVGVPPSAFVWTPPLDPADTDYFAADWSSLLGTEKIASIESITMTAMGQSLGVQVDDGSTDPARVPTIDTGGQKIGLWFKVADAFKANAAFSSPGTKVGVSMLIRTDSTPWRELERTWALTVLQQ